MNQTRGCRFRRLLFAACLLLHSGCRMGVPIHVWTPPTLQSTVGRKVMVPDIVGPPEVAEPIRERLLEMAPDDDGRTSQLVAAEDIPADGAGSLGPHAESAEGSIALASYDADRVSDLALAAKARRANFDFVLRGEILPDRTPRSIDQAGQRLALSWRLMPVRRELAEQAAESPTGQPIVVELESALEQYPDLALASDAESALTAAAVRRTLPLITPSVQRARVPLEIPYLLPGSRRIRRANALALAGRWPEAEAAWREVRERFPWSAAAVHNLAIAAVARQDFSTARELARRAVRLIPSKLHQETLVWVEQRQRAYHEAFQLPDPAQGWRVTH
jgi:tetratricopeptide (TPR) repeat protein